MQVSFPYGDLLAQLGDLWRSPGSFEVLLPEVLRLLGESDRLESAAFLLLSYDQWSPQAVPSGFTLMALWPPQTVPLHGPWLPWSQGQTAWLHGSEPWGAISEGGPSWWLPDRPSLWWPLLGGGDRPWGFLLLQRSPGENWSLAFQQMLRWVVPQLAYRWLQDRRLAQVQTLVEERTSQLQWSLDMQGKLGERMRHQIEELQRLHELKDDFLSAISHELNTPLSTMKIAVKMLRQGDRSENQKQRYLEILDQELRREQQLIQELLYLQKLEHRPPKPQGQALPLAPLLTQLAQTFASQWHQQKGLEIAWIAPPEPWLTDGAELEAILRELLHNAGKYAAPQTRVTLEASIVGDRLHLAITNQGQGIPPEEQGVIFEKFRRGQGAIAQAIPGTGLGLALVKARVQQLNGTIGVTSLPLAAEVSAIWSTTFFLLLPPLVPPP